MNNYNCNQGCGGDCGCGCHHGAGVIAGPCVSRNCGKSNENLRIKTVVLQPSLGTDEEGQPYAPRLGAYTNTIVTYQANDAVYLYDSRGIYTKLNVTPEDIEEKIHALMEADNTLNQAIVKTAEMLQTNINMEVNARVSDRDNLQTNINQEVENREGADAEINAKLEGMNHDVENLLELTEAFPNTIVSDITGETTETGTTLTISKSTLNSPETSTSEIIIPSNGPGGDDPRLTDAGAERANRLPDYVMSGFNPVTSVDDGVQLSMSGYKLSDDGPIESTTVVPLASTTSNGIISSADKTKLNRIPQTVVSATGIRQTSDDKKTSILVKYKNTVTGEAYDDVTEIPVVSAQYNGLMSVADKAKLDGLSEGSITSIGDVTYSADTVNLGSTQLTAAKGTQEGMVGQAGIMSSLQATQLAALALAYEAEEKGTTLYEGTASVNNITLSESGLSYDHLIVVAEYMGMGSAALRQQVSAVFYPTNDVKAFQMTTTDITVGDAPAQATVQDIWTISDNGTELDLVSSTKSQLTKNGTLDFEVTPETTSMFIITKVVGFGKKSVIQS